MRNLMIAAMVFFASPAAAASEPELDRDRHQRHPAGGKADRLVLFSRPSTSTCSRSAVRQRAPRCHLRREPLPEKIILPAEVIDKTNYKAWLVPVDQRSCPEWSEVAR